MSYFTGVTCIRCGRPLRNSLIFDGCPDCLEEGYTVNYKTVFDYDRLKEKVKWPLSGSGFWKYKPFFAINSETNPVSLGEGNTPLLHLKKLGEALGLNNLYIKDESRNPTWSYKDRLCSVAVTRAVQEGAEVITISTTGNHGASTAAYAAAAGIPCVVFTVPQVPDVMKTLMQSYGAYVVALPKPEDRWTIMRECVNQFGWFPTSGYVSPPIGSNPYGIDGYKTIAFEIYEELNTTPQFVAIPTAYGDGLYGVWKGMVDLYEMGISSSLPQMVASEVFGSLKKTLHEFASYPLNVPYEWSKSFSIASGKGTYQSLQALKESRGMAEVSRDEETMEMQRLLASTEGIYAEAASVTSLVAISKLRKQGNIGRDDVVVSVMTSTGLKDPQATAEMLPPVETIQPNLKDLKALLKANYDMDL